MSRLANVCRQIWYRLEHLYYWIISPRVMFRCRHWHVLRMQDMATGIGDDVGIPVTAWKWKCRLCNRVFYDIAESGWEQLEAGLKRDEALKWMRDHLEEGEDDSKDNGDRSVDQTEDLGQETG